MAYISISKAFLRIVHVGVVHKWSYFIRYMRSKILYKYILTASGIIQKLEESFFTLKGNHI